MTRDLKKLISEMTLEEKASLCSGADFWHLKGIERLGIPSIMVTDGPHGLRKQPEGADHLGINDSIPATCFPSAAGMASSWNRDIINQVGIALGEECQAENVAVLLGPGANIKRSPLCGRNFEYFSEDPFLSSEMATSHIKGVQSQGVGTSLKHFAANNQEHRRMSVDAIVDERTLREIYLASFEGAVKKAKPWTVMCSYNRLNGTYCSENKRLLSDILRDEWGYEGFVVSDWGAVNERADGLNAGLELEMPPSGNYLGDKKIVAAVEDGKLSEAVLDRAVERLLKIIFKSVDQKKTDAAYDIDKHHALARQAAVESMVLLKNENQILPLKKEGKIAVVGALAQKPRFQGGGSSHINPTRLDNVYEEMKKTAGAAATFSYADGYDINQDTPDDKLTQEAQVIAKNADIAIIFAGLPDRYESEGYDRQHMRLPENHEALIEAVAAVQSKVVVVLSNGSPVEMPWLSKVNGLLEAYLGGQALGGAIADLLFGDVNPSGKLAETFPLDLRHNPSHLNFPGEGDRVEYREGIFVGYRYYEKTGTDVLFPFGYGLSYTTFEYSDIKLDKTSMQDTENLTVSVTVKNAGTRAGKEIVQLYVRDIESSVNRPDKELKGFEKIALEPSESKTITFTLGKRAFAYYNTELSDWYVESGAFELLIGSASSDIRLSAQVEITSTQTIKQTFHRNSTIGDIMGLQAGQEIAKQLSMFEPQTSEEPSDMMKAMMKYMPLRALLNFGGERFSEEMLEGIIRKLNEN